MAEQNAGEIIYTVDMQTASLMASTNKTDESLDRLQKGFDKTDASAKSFGRTSGRAANEIKPLSTAIRKANDEAAAGTSIFGKFGSMLGAFVGIGAATRILLLAESYGEMSERVEMATSSQQEFEMVQQRLLASANETYRSLKETQEIFILTASSLRAMGYDMNQALEVTESLSLAMVKSATSVGRANAATSAFSKSLSKGRVEGDAWESIIVAIPSIAEDLAEALGKSSTEVRRLGAEGKITADQLATGLRGSLDANRAAAEGMAVTVKDAYTQLINNLSIYLGEANKANEVTATMASALQAVGNNIADISRVLMAAGVGALAAYIAKQAILIAGSARATMAARAVAVAELEAARAHMTATTAAVAQATAYAKLGSGSAQLTAATNAQAAATARLAAAQAGVASAGRLILGALGGPVGVIALAASAAASLYLFRDSATDSASATDVLSRSIEKLTANQAQAEKLIASKALDNQKKTVQEIESEIDSLTARWSELTGALANPGARVKIAERLTMARSELDTAVDSAKQLEDRLKAIDSIMSGSGSGATDPTPTTSSEGQKQLAQMREQIELLRMSGEAREKLQAIQRLGENATAEERAEAEKLASVIFNLEAQQKKLEETKREQKKADDDLKKSTESNVKAISDLSDELEMASLKGLDLAQAAALLKLNSYATPEQISSVKRLTAELYAQEQKIKDMALARQLDPEAGAQATHEEELANLKRLNEAKIIEDQRYLDLKAQMETAHSENMRRIEEERFAAQSRANQLLIDSLNEMQSAGTNAITGLLAGTNSLTDAMQQLGDGIVRHAVDALVEMGIQHVKSIVMGQMAEKAAAASSIATAATTGAAITASYAPAAAAASVATMGGAATAGYSAMASAVPAMIGTLAGGRLHGGPVSADGMYRINENGRPEVFNAANGQQFMLPNTRGEVVSNKNASGGGASVMNNITITVASDGGVDSTSNGSDPANAEALAQGIRVVVVDEIERQSRPGGSLWSMQQNGRSF